jgi:hypothetical protein
MVEAGAEVWCPPQWFQAHHAKARETTESGRKSIQKIETTWPLLRNRRAKYLTNSDRLARSHRSTTKRLDRNQSNNQGEQNMRSLKKLSVLAIAVFAFSAIGVASASAAQFTASATGEITGKALETQVFTTNGGEVRCNNIDVTGKIEKTASPEQHTTITYTNCTAFGIATVHISPATYLFTANGEVHIKNTIKITVTGGIFGECTITVAPQTVKSVSYTNNAGKIKVTPNVTGIVYTSTGGVCGSSGANGTYKGAAETERVGGGTISWDA